MSKPAVQTFDTIGAVQDVLDEMVKLHKAADFSPTLKSFADGPLKETHAEFFERGAGPSGQVWPDWYWRDPKSYFDHPNLIASKRLQASMTTDSPDHIQQVKPRELAFGSSVPYAAIQNFGGEVRTPIALVGRHGGYLPAGTVLHLPQREFAGMTEQTVSLLCDETADREVAILKG